MNLTLSEGKYISNTAGFKDYFVLLKTRIIYLVIFSALTGIVMSGEYLHPFIAFITLICAGVGAGGASAINMWYDRDIDALMLRTQKRPIPAGLIAPETVLEIGLTLSFFSILLMAFAVNYLCAALLAFSIFFYTVIYTVWLKRYTSQNTVIGGVAGAFPPIIGWAAVTNSISVESCLLFLIIFLWSPPHFWAVALKVSEDYKKASIPMLPITHGKVYTEKSIIYYSIALFLVSILPFILKMNSWIYFVAAVILGAMFLYKACKIYFFQASSLKLFHFSIFYLFSLFFVMMVDKLIL